MIIKAIRRAYEIKKQRGWDKVYWAIDLHGVCLKSNYENGGYEFINEDAIYGLQAISNANENRLILWSSCYQKEQLKIIDFMEDHAILVDHFNCNPEERNTKTGCFEDKFYFSILLDDKAGFDPETDWKEIINFYKEKRNV